MLVWFRCFRLLIDQFLFQHEIYIVNWQFAPDTLPLIVWGYVENLCSQPPSTNGHLAGEVATGTQQSGTGADMGGWASLGSFRVIHVSPKLDDLPNPLQ